MEPHHPAELAPPTGQVTWGTSLMTLFPRLQNKRGESAAARGTGNTQKETHRCAEQQPAHASQMLP